MNEFVKVLLLLLIAGACLVGSWNTPLFGWVVLVFLILLLLVISIGNHLVNRED